MQARAKLHPSSCFPPSPAVPTVQNRLFMRQAPTQARRSSPCLTFIGFNSITYASIAALLTRRPSPSVERIKLLDPSQKRSARTTLHDLQVVAALSGSSARLEWVQSYWETRDSAILVIGVQHHQLEHESVWSWIQMNASLVESVVSQACRHSPHATLIVGTQPNELMTYVAFRASQFPCERVFGLGASVGTAHAHRTVLEQIGHVRGQINGLFVLGSGLDTDACTTTLTDHLTIDGIACSDVSSKATFIPEESTCSTPRLESRRLKIKEWNLIKLLNNRQTLYSNVQRRFPISTDLISRQRTVTKYLLSTATSSQQSKPLNAPSHAQLSSNWTTAMIIARLTRALLDGCEFQSNFVVNIAPIHHARNVYINYPTTIGSSPHAIACMLPFSRAHVLLSQRAFLAPYEKLQNKLRLGESED